MVGTHTIRYTNTTVSSQYCWALADFSLYLLLGSPITYYRVFLSTVPSNILLKACWTFSKSWEFSSPSLPLSFRFFFCLVSKWTLVYYLSYFIQRRDKLERELHTHKCRITFLSSHAQVRYYFFLLSEAFSFRFLYMNIIRWEVVDDITWVWGNKDGDKDLITPIILLNTTLWA